MDKKINKLAIIGGGASGIFLSILLGRENIPCHIFEREEEVLKKVRASGNGRCNFTNTNISRDYYLGDEIFLEKIGYFTHGDCLEFFKSLGILSRSLESGRVYPITMESKSMVRALEKEALDLGVIFHRDVEIRDVENMDGSFILHGDRTYEFEYLVLSSGGKKGISKNSLSNGYDLAGKFNHKITSLNPGISSFHIEDKKKIRGLNGLKVFSKVSLYLDGKFHSYECGDVLFRDYGVSGLAILQISNKVSKALMEGRDALISIDFIHEFTFSYIYDLVKSLVERSGNKELSLIFQGFVSEKLVKRALINLDINDGPSKDVKDSDIKTLIKYLKDFKLKVSHMDDNGQITIGGVVGQNIKDNLESENYKNLFFTGEILNIQGESGGYNLHWAWTSGKIVADSIIRRENE